MEANIQNQQLMTILESHQVPVSSSGNYLQIDGTDVKINAYAYANVAEHKEIIQLDINLISPRHLGERKLIESFGGVGKTAEESISDAFNKFCLSSLHPILSVFVNRKWEAGQIQWETRGKAPRSWDICYLIYHYSA